jgi:methionyl-tRNA formyltransferase
VINGELQTGVTTFKLKHEIDTGDILMQQAINILPEDNAGTIHDKLMYLGGELLLKTVRAIENGKSTQQRQSILAEGIELRHAPKIFKEDMRINWNDTTNNIHNKIRGLSPHPAAWTEIKETTVKIFRTSKGVHNSLSAGEIKTDNKNYLEIGTADGAISIEELQMAGKKKMNIKTFLMGCKF